MNFYDPDGRHPVIVGLWILALLTETANGPPPERELGPMDLIPDPAGVAAEATGCDALNYASPKGIGKNLGKLAAREGGQKASENFVKKWRERILKDLGGEAKQYMHNLKPKGDPDRTWDQIAEDVAETYEKFGKGKNPPNCP
jgi:hypothetical protein